MKLRSLVAAAILSSVGITAIAQQSALAGWGVGISVPGTRGHVRVDVDSEDSDRNDSERESSRDASSSSESSPQTAAKSEGFSGKSATYLDDYNGFRIDVPTEFSLGEKGQTTNWTGPIMDEGAVGIYVNAAPLPGVSPAMLQDTYKQQYEADRFYTDVVATQVKYGNKMVPALRVKEVNNQRGTRDMKQPGDHHRWHLFVFGNERVYTFGFTGMFQTFEDNEVQGVYEKAIASVELVPIVE